VFLEKDAYIGLDCPDCCNSTTFEIAESVTGIGWTFCDNEDNDEMPAGVLQQLQREGRQ
jgi:hypothetical protein